MSGRNGGQFTRIDDLFARPRANRDPDGYASFPETRFHRHATGCGFRSIEDAGAFLGASPDLVLADGKEEAPKDVCTLYSYKRSVDEIRQALGRFRDDGVNMPPLPGIFPDYPAPIVDLADGEATLRMARWGMPTPRQSLINRRTDPGVTNIRRKVREGEVAADLFGFLTTEPNAEVRAIHPKAMPVILTGRAEVETWLNAPWAEAKALRRPLPDGSLRIVARSEGGRLARVKHAAAAGRALSLTARHPPLKAAGREASCTRIRF